MSRHAVVGAPAGATSEAVLDQAIAAEEIVRGLDGVELVQTSVPGEGDTGFSTIVAALQGQPANSATLTVRYVDTVDLDQATTDLSTPLAPVKTHGYEVNVSEAAGFSSNNLNIIVSSEDPDDVAAATDA